MKNGNWAETFDRRTLLWLLVGSLVFNLGLGWELWRVNARRAGVPFQLQAGTVVEPIRALRIDGVSETIDYGASTVPTILYVFTPPCNWCERNVPSIRALGELAAPRFRFVGISLSSEGLAEYMRKNPLPFSVYSGLSEETRRKYGLGATPMTILIDREGRVRRVWRGAFSGKTRSEIETYFSVKLPQLILPETGTN